MSDKRRILIFSTAYFPMVGGAEIAMKEITDRIHDYDFDMITCRMSRDYPKVERIGNVNVYRVGIGIPKIDKIWLAFFGHRLGKKMHRQKNYCLVWSLMASYCGFAALSFKEGTGVKFLLTLQEGDSIEYILNRVRLLKKRFKKIFSQADAIQAISSFLLTWGKEMGFAGHIAEVVPNGVDIARFAADFDEEQIKRHRENFNFGDDSVIFITSSRLVPKNGVELVLRALPQLPDNVCFVICGSGELESELRTIARELGLEARVNFIGHQSHEDLPNILRASDYFIRPSLSEGLGNSFLEAMAVGIPVIGTRVGGIVDFLEHGQTGFVCKGHHPDQVVEVMNLVLTMSKQEKDYVNNRAQEMIRTRYNWEYIVSDMNNIFSVLCES